MDSSTPMSTKESRTAASLMRQTPLTCSGHTRPVVFLAFSELNPEDEAPYYSISACKDGKPMMRQGDTGDWVGTFEGHKGAVWGVDLNADASRAATGAADFSAKLWNAVSGEEMLNLAHKHIVKSVNFNSDSRQLATGSNDKILRIFDLNKAVNTDVNEGNNGANERQEAHTCLKGHTSHIKQVLFSNVESNTLLSLADDRTLRKWDLRCGAEVMKVDICPTGSIGGMELSRETDIITVAHNSKVTFYNASTLQVVKSVEVPTVVYTASLLFDKKIFVCGGEDLKLYKFDFETGSEIENFKGHFGPIHCVRFSPDGELYASGSEDGTLRLWQTEIGKTYGLWKVVDETNANKAETAAV